ncbi:MAG: alpha-amylase family glycosyl hydrolase [Propionibacteriaceae bacterium]|nr:alpha-amylase family glycosyl hydrolase [Propionibacteriaceae bacterium]
MATKLLTERSTVLDLYRTPVGRDIVDKLFLQTGMPRRLIYLFSGLPLGVIDKLTRRITGPGLVDMILDLVNGEADRPLHGRAPDPTPWWREAVFYQVYPRSFADSDGDGVGDLRGIIGKLDYLAKLGVDCLWLSPVFDSPNEDMGYDVRDYRAIMAEMGTLEDMDELIAGCHERGMRIILDLVVNHTSEEHEWFQQALTDPDGKYGNYYFLREGSAGNPPNNWKAFFSGSAWRWFPQAKRWGLKLFSDGQMDLNWDNPEVREEVADIVRWWMQRGVDGFRMDVINYISKKPGLPDGHPFIGQLLEFVGVEHYFYGPRLHEFLRGLRREGFTRRVAPSSTPRRRLPGGGLGDPLPPDMIGIMVGETPGIGMELGRLLSGYGRGELDLIFNFDVLDNPGRTRWDTYEYQLG